MTMDDLFKVTNLNINQKVRNLDIKAMGEVKSTKFFPVFKLNNQEYIFKPLSKTKPRLSPLFSYSEVFWSYVYQHYFENQAPQAKLAVVEGMSKEQPKYYDKGILIPNMLNSNQKLISLYEFFLNHPDKNVNIKSYINYCEYFYNYRDILKSSYLEANPNLNKQIAKQILLSILRADQNFHYENINFIMENEQIIQVAPAIDFEYSTMFYLVDKPIKHHFYMQEYLKSMYPISQAEDVQSLSLENVKSIATIVELYPEIVYQFLENLDTFNNAIANFKITDEDNFITSFNSDSWQIGHEEFKNHDLKAARELAKQIPLVNIDKDQVFDQIITEVKLEIIFLKEILNFYLKAYQKQPTNLASLTIEQLEDLVGHKYTLKI